MLWPSPRRMKEVGVADGLKLSRTRLGRKLRNRNSASHLRTARLTRALWKRAFRVVRKLLIHLYAHRLERHSLCVPHSAEISRIHDRGLAFPGSGDRSQHRDFCNCERLLAAPHAGRRTGPLGGHLFHLATLEWHRLVFPFPAAGLPEAGYGAV